MSDGAVPWIVGGVVVAAAIGGVVYYVTRPKAPSLTTPMSMKMPTTAPSEASAAGTRAMSFQQALNLANMASAAQASGETGTPELTVDPRLFEVNVNPEEQ
jgi:hypothetical protein